jgi:glutathione peroxidase
MKQVELLDGSRMPEAVVKGKVVLVVNVASYCTFTPQYFGLQKLWETYNDRGLVVLGVPCNQFSQEPGGAKEIRNFCESNYGVTFPLLSKQDVNGSSRSELYSSLIGSGVGQGQDVRWNFEKFLVGRDGEVIGRFGSSVSPSDPSLVAAIEMALAREAP